MEPTSYAGRRHQLRQRRLVGMDAGQQNPSTELRLGRTPEIRAEAEDHSQRKTEPQPTP
ncbi:MAG: hypothetical protein AAF657_24190 [Acidobacteriota bacterium]